MKNKFENLLLLEFMINKVIFFENEYKIDKTYLSQLGETCVQIKFRGACLLEITSDENTKIELNERGHKIVVMESGKSCLLSMNQLINNCNNEVCLCICRKTPPGDEKEYFALGEAKVSLEPIFKALRKASCAPATKSMRCESDIKDRQCSVAGKVEFFIRITDLGKNIVTMFQLGAGESSFYFKGTDRQLEEADDEDEEDFSCSVCPESKFDVGEHQSFMLPKKPIPDFRQQMPQTPFYPYKEGPTYNQPMQHNMRTWPVIGPCKKTGNAFSFQPCQPPRQSTAQGIGQGMSQSMGQGRGPGLGNFGQTRGSMQTQSYSQRGQAAGTPLQYSPEQHLPQYRDGDYEQLDGEYKEISAEVNGYEVKIKLLRRPKKTTS